MTLRTKLPKYVHGFTDYRDASKSRHYLRRPGFKRWRCPACRGRRSSWPPIEPRWQGSRRRSIVAPKAKPGSFAALAASYFASTAYLP